MSDLVHLTPASHARRIARGGIAARGHRAGVFCMPVLADFTLTHQWARELRRWKPGPSRS